MEKEEQLGRYYKETKNNLDEQRRVIDYDMKRVLVELEKDRSTAGNLKVLRYKSEIEQAEGAYDDRVAELKSIDDDLRPILIAINAHKDDPLKIQTASRSFFDVYIDEKKQIIATAVYTKM